jgi:hypothetical protein
VPPLFLRFLNLLVNDAIFLLDEGLNYMRTIQVSSSPGLTSRKIVAYTIIIQVNEYGTVSSC